MTQSKLVIAILLGTLLIDTSSAQLIDAYPTQVDNSDGWKYTAGHITNDIMIDFIGEYNGSEMSFNLDSGEMWFSDFAIYVSPPNASIFSLVPQQQFTSHIALGFGATSTSNGDPYTGPWGDPELYGDSANMYYLTDHTTTFGLTSVDIAWGPGTWNPVRDQIGFFTTRLTLSEDAAGIVHYSASVDGQISDFVFLIQNGKIIIPEPSTFLMLGLASTIYITKRLG